MVEDTMRFMKEINPDFVDLNIAYPLPGTEYHRIALESGLFSEKELQDGDYSKPIVRTIELSTRDLIRYRRKALLSFYLRPSYIVRTLLGVRSLKVLGNYLKSGLRLLKTHAFTPSTAE